jgi:hypothetical protein
VQSHPILLHLCSHAISRHFCNVNETDWEARLPAEAPPEIKIILTRSLAYGCNASLEQKLHYAPVLISLITHAHGLYLSSVPNSFPSVTYTLLIFSRCGFERLGVASSGFEWLRAAFRPIILKLNAFNRDLDFKLIEAPIRMKYARLNYYY